MEKRVNQTSRCDQEQLGDGGENYLQDRISKLPNEMLICIISRLTFREAASTSVLSKTWRYLWTFSTGSLDLDGSKKKWEEPWLLEVEQSKYVTWVNQVLDLHQGSTVDEFKVCFQLDNSFKCSINKSIGFAIAKRAQRFDLDLKTTAGLLGAPERYTFPHECNVYIQTSRGLSSIKSLRSLSLKSANITGEILEFFLSSCPLLERLCVHSSEHLLNLKVAGSSLQLKYLENMQLPQCELTKLRHLILRVRACDSDSLLGLTRLMEASPLLQKFTLQLTWIGPSRRRKKRNAPKCPIDRHLKVVEFVGFVGRPIDLELAMYVLGNAVMLEKIIINTTSPYLVGTQWESEESEEKLAARKRAKQLKTKLPQGVELVIH
ncbi:hypothetical protein L1049_027979 [Liquidambar formosana]|uniref:F-box domain-containing protein n=1 Tax=Liquidambar formosana TaxID=63359 RepID=A0AAP0RI72_LIQFO